MKNFLKSTVRFKLLTFIVLCMSTLSTHAQYFEIESILVDACQSNTSAEALNERFSFRVGNNDLQVNKIKISFPNTTFNLSTNQVIQTKVQQLNSLNNLKGGCGQFISPNPSSFIPAGALVYVFTSYLMDTSLNQFPPINENVYVLFNNSTSTTGYFANYDSSTSNNTRDLTLVYNNDNVNDEKVIYRRNLLVNSDGVNVADDGAIVYFTPQGVASYDNVGCETPSSAPSPLLEIVNTTNQFCADSSITLQLNSLHVTSIQWSSSIGTFSNTNEQGTELYIPSNATGSFTVTVSGITACNDVLTDVIELNIIAPQVPVFDIQELFICKGANVPVLPSISNNGIEGQWIPAVISNQESNVYTFFPNAGQCSIDINFGVEVFETEEPNVNVLQSFCSLQNPKVNNLSAVGENLKWYATATSTAVLTSNTVLTSGTYYVSQTQNGCESTRVAVEVVVNTTPVPTISNQMFCNQTVTVADLEAAGSNVKWYTSLTSINAMQLSEAVTSGTYYASQTIDGCESSRVAVVIVVNTTLAPTVAVQEFCSNVQATVANLVANGENLKWYATATSTEVLASNTVLTSGTYYVSQTQNGCESTRVAVEIVVNTTPVPTINNQTFCNQTVTVADLEAVGSNVKWYTSLTSMNALQLSDAVTSGTYYASQTINGCESARVAVVIVVNTTLAPTATAQEFCVNNNATVANLVANGENLKWYATATSIAVLASNTVLTSGTYYVSQTQNGCESTRVAVEIVVNTTPVPTINNQTFCNQTVTVADLEAVGSNVKWYTSLTSMNALQLSDAVTSGTYYASQTIDGCESTRVAVEVVVNATPMLTINNQTFCNQTVTVADLEAAGSNVKWYTSLTSMNALQLSDAVTSGTYYASQTIDGCESTRVAVEVVVNATPVPTLSNQTFCNQTVTVADLEAAGSNVKWYTSLTSINAMQLSDAVTSGTYYASQTINGCESARVAVVIVVNTTLAPTATAQEFCVNNNATVANLVANGENLKWYATATSTEVLASNTVLTTGTYYVSQTQNGCESSRVSLEVVVNTTPIPPINNQTFCNQTVTVADLEAVGSNVKWYTSLTSINALQLSDAVTSGTYYASQTIDGCESTRVAVEVVVNATPVPTLSNQTFCNQTVTVADLEAAGSNVKWYTSLTSINAMQLSDAVTSGTYYASQTINGCESARTAVLVTIKTTVAPTATAQEFCVNNYATVANLVATGENLKWYATATSTAVLASNTVLVSGTYYVSQTQNGCESSRVAVEVVVNTTPIPPINNQTFCNQTVTVADLEAVGSNVKWYTSLTSINALQLSDEVTSGTYYASQTINGCESAKVAVVIVVNTTLAPTAAAQEFCSNVQATVANLVATGENLKWYATATSTEVLASNTVLVSGTYYVSQTQNGCESARTAVLVTIKTTVAPTAAAQEFCVNNNATVANLVANGENLKWYATATSTAVLALNTVLTTGTYYVSQTQNGCESTRVAVEVVVNIVHALPTQMIAICELSIKDVVLVGTVNNATVLWFTTQNGGEPLNVDTILQTGTYYVSQSIGSCETVRTPIVVNRLDQIIPTAPSNQTFCSGSTISSIVYNAYPTSVAKWYATVDSVTPLSTSHILENNTTYYLSYKYTECESVRIPITVEVIQTEVIETTLLSVCSNTSIQNIVIDGYTFGELKWFNTMTSSIPLLGAQTLFNHTYYVEVISNGCSGVRKPLQVVVLPSIPQPLTQVIDICGGGIVSDLVVTGVIGASYKWYNSLNSNVPLAANTSLVTGTYYVEQIVGECSSVRKAIAVRITSKVAPVINAQQVCFNTKISDLLLPTVSGATYKWYLSPNSNVTLDPSTVLTSGNYYVRRLLHGCESNAAMVSISVLPIPAQPIGESMQTLPEGSTISDIVVQPVQVVWFATESDALNGINPLANDMPLIQGNTYYAVTMNSFGCASLPKAVTIQLTLGINDLDIESLKLYPNPTYDRVTISYKEHIDFIEVYTMIGQLVIKQTVNQSEYILDLTSLSSGTYIIKLSVNRDSQFIKVVKK